MSGVAPDDQLNPIDDLDPVRLLADRILLMFFSSPLSWSIAWTVRPAESIPTASKNLSRGSMLNPRGVFSVGHSPIPVSVPFSGSIL